MVPSDPIVSMNSSRNAELSFGIDENSELVLANGQCQRKIRKDIASFYKSFLQSRCAKDLIASGQLIQSEIMDESENELLVRHPELPFVLYPYEWTQSMLEDAGLFLLSLVTQLSNSGYTLKDGHPWNVVFDGSSPVFVDLTSIVELDSHNGSLWQDDFETYFVNPLEVFRAGNAPIARLILSSLFFPPKLKCKGKVGKREVLRNLSRRMFSSGSWLQNRFQRNAEKGPSHLERQSAAISRLEHTVSSANRPPNPNVWTDYYQGTNELPEFSPDKFDIVALASSTPKHKLIYNLLESRRPKSVLDIGCNAGLYSFFASSLGARVVGFDTDERAADEMYISARNRGEKVTVGCGDFVAPIRAAEYLHKPRLRPLNRRVQADMVLCLAVVHHWVFKRLQLKFPDVVAVLADVTTQSLVVEFVPPDEKHVATWMTPSYSWYNLDNFLNALKKEFQCVTVHESFPSPRKLVVCEVK